MEIVGVEDVVVIVDVVLHLVLDLVLVLASVVVHEDLQDAPVKLHKLSEGLHRDESLVEGLDLVHTRQLLGTKGEVLDSLMMSSSGVLAKPPSPRAANSSGILWMMGRWK